MFHPRPPLDECPKSQRFLFEAVGEDRVVGREFEGAEIDRAVNIPHGEPGGATRAASSWGLPATVVEAIPARRELLEFPNRTVVDGSMVTRPAPLFWNAIPLRYSRPRRRASVR